MLAFTDTLTDRSSKPIGYFQSSQPHDISPASRVCDTNQGKIQKIQAFYLLTPSKWGGVSKMKILARWTKLNHISYKYSVDPSEGLHTYSLGP